jgi:hypothetical protein
MTEWDNCYGYAGNRRVVSFNQCGGLHDELSLRFGGGYQSPMQWLLQANRR